MGLCCGGRRGWGGSGAGLSAGRLGACCRQCRQPRGCHGGRRGSALGGRRLRCCRRLIMRAPRNNLTSLWELGTLRAGPHSLDSGCREFSVPRRSGVGLCCGGRRGWGGSGAGLSAGRLGACCRQCRQPRGCHGGRRGSALGGRRLRCCRRLIMRAPRNNLTSLWELGTLRAGPHSLDSGCREFSVPRRLVWGGLGAEERKEMLKSCPVLTSPKAAAATASWWARFGARNGWVCRGSSRAGRRAWCSARSKPAPSPWTAPLPSRPHCPRTCRRGRLTCTGQRGRRPSKRRRP